MDNRQRTSVFKSCLSSLEVPQELLDGVSIIKVNNSGKMREAFLTLSQDKFTIYISYSKLKNGGFRKTLVKPLLRKVSSISNHDDADGDQRAIDIGSIDRIQRGQSTLKFELAQKAAKPSAKRSTFTRSYKNGSSSFELEPSQSFSIIFHGERTLDLMTMTESEKISKQKQLNLMKRDEIVNALNNLIGAYAEAKKMVGNDVQSLRYIWLDVDKDKSDTINLSELGVVLDRLNYYTTKHKLGTEYSKFCQIMNMTREQQKKGLSFEQCTLYLHKIKRDTWQVKPVHQIWDEIFGSHMKNGKPRIRVSAETFLSRFLHAEQGETNATIEDVRKLFLHLNKLEVAVVISSFRHNHDTIDKYIDKERFEAYLLSAENDAFDPLRSKFDSTSLDKPLSGYWINSSHNTYLTGDQLTSQSSVEMYMNALYKGCRCVELDIWDGEREGPNLEPIPIIFHGHTMTTKIPFKDVISAIKVFLNFNPDSLPIILSLENHCSIPYQEVMADNLTSILGNNLFIPDENDLTNPLLSPNDLKGMVILKGRRPDLVDDEYVDSSDSDEDTAYPDSVLADYRSDPSDRLLQNHEQTKKEKFTTKIAPSLAKITFFHGTSFQKFRQSIQMPKFHMHSFDESKVRKLCKQQMQEWIHYNQMYMSRVYPSGKRIDSSNYSPMLAWATGCQMAALNFQTTDAHMRLNDGRFRENGGCGYICKPISLMKDCNVTLTPLNLSIKILSGTCLPKPKGAKKGEVIDPFVKVNLCDVNKDSGKEIMIEKKTKNVHNNGFFPIWNESKFKFLVMNPDVAILQLSVWDKDPLDSNFIAAASIPISCLRTGYRSVKLYDANSSRTGAFNFASLLISVRLRKVRTVNTQAEI